MSNSETTVLLIAYDISDDEKRSRTASWIERQTHVKLSESVYAIKTTLGPRAVLNVLSLNDLGEKDAVHVITLTQPFEGTEDVASKWLEDHLPVDQEEVHNQTE